MSDIFDALVKAQRAVDSQREATPAPEVGGPGNGTSAAVRPAADRLAAERPATEPPAVAAQRGAAVTDNGRRRRGWRARLWPAAHRNGHEPNVPLLLAKPDSVIGEQFRVLRTRIESAPPGLLMLTSALDREGKTLCAANLAIALAMRVGPEVILVDADLRHSSLGPYFGINRGPGLADYLMGEADWRECLVPTQYAGLHLLPAGHHTTMACELLGSDRMRSIVTELKTEFPRHYVLFDTPPILLTADPEVVARLMDHVVLVVRAGVTPRAAVLKAIASLNSDRFLGIVLNDATQNISTYYHYGRRYGYYYHGDHNS